MKMNTLEKLELNHKNAMLGINEYQNDAEIEMREITNFLLDTDANPYSFLPNGWQDSLESSTKFISLLNFIHHALFDDGSISFPMVNGEPRICFVYRYEDNYTDYPVECKTLPFRAVM